MHFHNAVLQQSRHQGQERRKESRYDAPFAGYFMVPTAVFQLAGALCKREFLAAASVTQKGSRRCIFLPEPRC